jgi:peptide/nickel transport system permease protein
VFGFAARKILHTLFVGVGVVTLVFAALRLSGDPAATMLPGDASVDELRDLRRALGLDRPMWAQYLGSLRDAATGDFGTSFRHHQPALPLVLERLPATLELAGAALLLAAVALPLGVLAAIYRGRTLDALAMGFAVVGQAKRARASVTSWPVISSLCSQESSGAPAEYHVSSENIRAGGGGRLWFPPCNPVSRP